MIHFYLITQDASASYIGSGSNNTVLGVNSAIICGGDNTALNQGTKEELINYGTK